MNRTTSTYLDLVRFMAACFVFLHHLNDWSGKALPIFAPMQSEAVIVFFVLSGFVIGYVTDTKEHRLEEYALSRMARIYSVAFPALIATFGLDAIAAAGLPHSDLTSGWLPRVEQFAAGLFFLNEVWGHHIAIGSNGPYWSLGYEVPYYIAFAAYAFGRGRWRYILAGGVLIIYGPRVAMLAPIWLMGVLSYRICSKNSIAQRVGWILLVASSVLWIMFYAGIYLRIIPSSVVPIYWHHWEISEDIAVGLLFSLNVIGFHAVSPSFAKLTLFCEGTIRWIAGATFSLYLFHYPIVHCLCSVLHWQIRGAGDMILVTLVVAISTFALAEVTERRKNFYRKLIRAAIFRPTPAAAS